MQCSSHAACGMRPCSVCGQRHLVAELLVRKPQARQPLRLLVQRRQQPCGPLARQRAAEVQQRGIPLEKLVEVGHRQHHRARVAREVELLQLLVRAERVEQVLPALLLEVVVPQRQHSQGALLSGEQRAQVRGGELVVEGVVAQVEGANAGVALHRPHERAQPFEREEGGVAVAQPDEAQRVQADHRLDGRDDRTERIRAEELFRICGRVGAGVLFLLRISQGVQQAGLGLNVELGACSGVTS